MDLGARLQSHKEQRDTLTLSIDHSRRKPPQSSLHALSIMPSDESWLRPPLGRSMEAFEGYLLPMVFETGPGKGVEEVVVVLFMRQCAIIRRVQITDLTIERELKPIKGVM